MLDIKLDIKLQLHTVHSERGFFSKDTYFHARILDSSFYNVDMMQKMVFGNTIIVGLLH